MAVGAGGIYRASDEMNVLDVLTERGFVKDASDVTALRRRLEESTSVYCGYDATATSFHVGNAVTMMMLAWFQRCGHRPIALMGGGTSLVGDPSGRTRERPMLSPEDINLNLERLRPQLGAFISFEQGALMLDNADWLMALGLMEFLRDVGSRFSVNHMLSHETYRVKLESSGLSYLELSYQLLQAYDFLHLYRNLGCTVQIGGSDQWSNILAGADLIRRAERSEAFALVCPLIETADGTKMGKSESGAVWLSGELLSPYDYYQFWINTADADVERFLAIFTFLPMEEVRRLSSLQGADLRAAKEVLAMEATTIVHGMEAARTAQEAARALFQGRGSLDSVPTTAVPRASLSEGVPLLDLAVDTGLLASRREARRIIEQGGLRLNDEVISDADRLVTEDDLDNSGTLLLRAGKKRYQRVAVG